MNTTNPTLQKFALAIIVAVALVPAWFGVGAISGTSSAVSVGSGLNLVWVPVLLVLTLGGLVDWLIFGRK